MDIRIPVVPDTFYSNPFPVLIKDNYADFGEQSGTQWKVPDYRSILTMENVTPLFCYTIIWYSINLVASKYCWIKWKGFRRKRLINLTTSLIHSMVTGCYLIVYVSRNARIMFASPLHYYSYLEMQLILLSMGYFIYDAMDMCINDTLNANSLVLMFHHISSLYFLSLVLVTHKFLLYCYWALLMEVSSIFLHCRSLLNQSKLSTTTMTGLYSLISYANIVVFVLFRFLVQLFLFIWAIVNMYNMHWFFFLMCMLSDLCFLTTNCALFLRLLHSDGFLCWKVPNERLGVFIENAEYADIEKSELLEEL